MPDLVLQDGTVLAIVVPQNTVTVAPPSTNPVVLVPVAGVGGPAGPQGRDGRDITEVWHGDGPPPALIVGSRPDDLYVDDLTGDLYRLLEGL